MWGEAPHLLNWVLRWEGAFRPPQTDDFRPGQKPGIRISFGARRGLAQTQAMNAQRDSIKYTTGNANNSPTYNIYSMLRNSASGPLIGLPGRILHGLLPGKHRILRPAGGPISALSRPAKIRSGSTIAKYKVHTDKITCKLLEPESK